MSRSEKRSLWQRVCGDRLMSDPLGLPGEQAEFVLGRDWCIAFPRLLPFLAGR